MLELGVYLYLTFIMLLVIAAGTALICTYFREKAKCWLTMLAATAKALSETIEKTAKTRGGNKE